MKKIFAAFLALTIVMSPTIGALMTDDVSVAEAKRVKSGKSGFNKSNPTPNQSNINKKNDQKQNVNQTPKKSPDQPNKRGGFLGGLMMGGLAGLLFGSLLGGLGALGPIVGMILNILFIVVIIGLLFRLIKFLFGKKEKKDEDHQSWRSS